MTSLTLPKTSPALFADCELALLDHTRIPQHVAIIPDGNRRWAKRQSASVTYGHETGAQRLIDTVKAAKEIGVSVITFYLFSTENWARPFYEVKGLMLLLEKFLREQRQAMIENGIRMHTIGELSKLPASAQWLIQDVKDATSLDGQIDMVLALNYGSRDEICRAVQKMMQAGVPTDQVNEKVLSSYLDTASWPDPDLLIRTSAEHRISNFLTWQLSYSELYTPDVLWPDFSPQHFLESIRTYQTRERRMGGSS